MSTPTPPNSKEELREQLIDKLDDQRFGNNIVNKKLLYKDIEWIVDELLPVIESHTHHLLTQAFAAVRPELENNSISTRHMNGQQLVLDKLDDNIKRYMEGV